jgi:beta-glucosidase/6-phospho-beta-glucosidase/beta-galactosidase
MSQIEIIGGFETTYMPGFDVDVAETTAHIEQRRTDLELLRSCGVTSLRYPVRWHRVESRPGQFDWSETDVVMQLFDEIGLTPIVDLVHHTSYPRWLHDGFADAGFPNAYLRYIEAFARRYPNVRDYTLFNEPFSTLFLCGHEAAWPPHRQGMQSFVALLGNVLPALVMASQLCAELLPEGRHVWVDSCERHTGSGSEGRKYARYANDRRFFVLDALLGRVDSVSNRPFAADVVAHGGASLLELEGCRVDVLGLDYYAHCQWHFGSKGGTAPSHHVVPFADLIQEYADRYSRPCVVTETNIRGTPSDRATWLKYVLEQCEVAQSRGVDLRGLCWFPFIDSCDWDSLLRVCSGSIDPVGAVSLLADRTRRTSTMTRTFTAAARGAHASELPAYTWQAPVSQWMLGYRRHVRHWDWQPPPAEDVVESVAPTDHDFRPLGAVARG